jgi:hypothetical protein
MIHLFYRESKWRLGMRGRFQDQGGLFSYISPEARVPANHPLRNIRDLVREVLKKLRIIKLRTGSSKIISLVA